MICNVSDAMVVIRELEKENAKLKEYISRWVFAYKQNEEVEKLAKDNAELRAENERLKKLTHFGYSEVPELREKLAVAREAIESLMNVYHGCGCCQGPEDYDNECSANKKGKQALAKIEGKEGV